MIMQSGITEMFMRLSNSTDVKKTAEAGSGKFPQFKEILGQTVERGSGMDNTSQTFRNNRQNPREGVENPDSNDKIKTFREIARKEGCGAKVQGNPQSRMESDDVRTEDPSDGNAFTRKQEDAVMASLADMLGMAQSDLLKVLKAVEVKPEELIDASKAGETASKLSGLLGLDSMQENVLEKLLQITAQKAGLIMTGSENLAESEGRLNEDSGNRTMLKQNADGTGTKNGDARVDDAGDKTIVFKSLEVIKLEKESPELSELASHLKAKLQEMVRQMQTDPAGFQADISQEVEGLLDQKIQLRENTVQPGISDSQNTGIVQVKAEGEAAPQTTGSGTGRKGSEENEQEAGHESKNVLVMDKAIPMVKDQENQYNTVQNPIAAQSADQIKAMDAGEALRAQKNLPVPKGEVLNQVVEKAKVMITGEKSEMVMDLKPESLGKLTLKIATEQGIVVAKFVAENRQVKEIIESNMQLLKDSLEKQGMMVQGFSVSVGQDSYRGPQDNRFSQQEGSNAGRTAGSTVTAAGHLDAGERLNKMNAYNWSESSINLTA